jgi:hypothetical protein
MLRFSANKEGAEEGYPSRVSRQKADLLSYQAYKPDARFSLFPV